MRQYSAENTTLNENEVVSSIKEWTLPRSYYFLSRTTFQPYWRCIVR